VTIPDDLYAIGREGLIHVGDFELSVIVRDVRIRSLVVDFLVEPTSGTGLAWIESKKVRIVQR
jgi:hypothetical protein